MPAPSKPAKRGPKPKKPIARSKKRIPKVTRTPRGQSEAALNALFGRYIRARDQYCRIKICRVLQTWRPFEPTTQHCHLLGKGAHPKIRWNQDNAVGGCEVCHRWMTNHPTTWLLWSLNHIGPEKYDELLTLDRGPSPDRAQVHAELIAALAALGEK